MSGLEALQAEGLRLQDTPAGAVYAELLHWHRVADGDMPDAETRVLLWISDGEVHEWDGGWWDGDGWRLAESGGRPAGTVLYWAEPEGPPATTTMHAECKPGEVLTDLRHAAQRKWAGHPPRQQAGLLARAGDEIAMLRGQRDVLVRALRACDEVISTLVPESAEEQAMLERLAADLKALTMPGAGAAPAQGGGEPDLLSC